MYLIISLQIELHTGNLSVFFTHNYLTKFLLCNMLDFYDFVSGEVAKYVYAQLWWIQNSSYLWTI